MESREIDKELDKVKSDLAGLREDMASLLDALKKSGVDQGKEFYDRASERVRNAGETLRNRADEAYGTIGKEVCDYPLMSLLAAFASGLVVGMVMDRHR